MPRPARASSSWTPNGSTGPWAAELEGAGAIVNLTGAGLADKRWTDARKKLLHRQPDPDHTQSRGGHCRRATEAARGHPGVGHRHLWRVRRWPPDIRRTTPLLPAVTFSRNWSCAGKQKPRRSRRRACASSSCATASSSRDTVARCRAWRCRSIFLPADRSPPDGSTCRGSH